MNIPDLIRDLITLPGETEWVEFKESNAEPETIVKNISAISNSAALAGRQEGYICWGISDIAHKIVGTKFEPLTAKKGNEPLESWLRHSLSPDTYFSVQSDVIDGKKVVVFTIPAASYAPVRFNGEVFIRVGSTTKNIKNNPEQERRLWEVLSKRVFEKEAALEGCSAQMVLQSLDFPRFFELVKQPLPSDQSGILERLEKESFIRKNYGDSYDILNLGAVLFANDLNNFPDLGRKAIRVIVYSGTSRIQIERQFNPTKGYAIGFEEFIETINGQLPQNEPIGTAFRQSVKMYPEIAIRELVANMLIHQDFHITGTGPMVEIFKDRVEITNPGKPLIDTLRFIDEPPRSRNDAIASFMRRIGICEELGSGIDKVIESIEVFQLPAPDFQVTGDNTKVVLYAPKLFREMSKPERIRACYQHCCLQFVSGQDMTNNSLRVRLNILKKNYPMVSKIISDTMEVNLIKIKDPENPSKKFTKYIPFWA